MGCPDDVEVPCPQCGEVAFFQSKGGECLLSSYNLSNAPDDVMSNVNRHSPYQCLECGTWFAVNEEKRLPIITDARRGPHVINGWYKKGKR